MCNCDIIQLEWSWKQIWYFAKKYYYYQWGETESIWHCGHYRPLSATCTYQPQMIDDGDCGAIGGLKIGRETRSTLRKPAPAAHCPPQIQHDLTPGSNPGRRCGKPANNRLSLCKEVGQEEPKNKTNSLVFVRKRAISTGRPPHVDEVSTNFCG
jgi:hypothetical protein